MTFKMTMMTNKYKRSPAYWASWPPPIKKFCVRPWITLRYMRKVWPNVA